MSWQKTIAKQTEITGIGLHTGKQCKVIMLPALPNEGLVLLKNNQKYPISLNNVVDTTRSTNIKIDDEVIYTVEHLLSAVVGLQIDNLILEIEGGEVPILDGSAKYFVDKIREVGIKEEAIHKSKFIVQKNIEWKDHETNAEYLLIPSSSFSITCMIDYHSKSLGKQYASLERWADYITEIAPAKTFCFLHEIEMLYKSGLIKGGNLTNALVFSEFNIEPEKAKWLTDTFNQPIFSVPEKGILNPIYQTFDNEAARHKTLDLIGDLSLLGVGLQGRLIVIKPGHTSNIRFSKYLKEYIGAKIL